MKWLYQIGYSKKRKHLLKIKFKKIYNRKPLRQTTTENNKTNDKALDKKFARKMTNRHCFTNRNLQTSFKINLDSHSINHANSILTITPIYRVFGIETSYINRILKEIATSYARLINQ